MPHVVGAIDGKHIAMDCPKNTGSQFYNSKGFFSQVLLAVCDAKYKFLFVDVGQYGSTNDSAVLKNSEIGKRLNSNSLNIPPGDVLDENYHPPTTAESLHKEGETFTFRIIWLVTKSSK